MKFLQSGIVAFFAGIVIIFGYAFLFHNGDIYAMYYIKTFILNIPFSLLFWVSCCIVAFNYGKRKNKSGLIGLICIFMPYFLVLIITLEFVHDYVLPDVLSKTFVDLVNIIAFSYSTLFFIPHEIAFYVVPFIIIIFILCSWLIGKKRTQIK